MSVKDLCLSLSRSVLLIALLLFAQAALAQEVCTWTVDNVAFGAVDVLGGGAVDVTANVQINCSGGVASLVARVCPNIGSGTGGATASARKMVSGSNQLSYQLYQDAARTNVWGSFLWGLPATPPTLTVSLNLSGAGTLNTTLYGRVFAGQSTVAPGSYLSAFSAVDARLTWTFCVLVLCPACSGSMAGSTDTTFNVTASVAANCLVSATTLDFGTAGVLGANIDASNSISVTCTQGTPWTAGLNGGLTSGGTVSMRKMSGSGGATINYTIYKDSARTQVWGDGTLGTQLVSGTGSGSAQAQTGFGRVPPQATPAAATYTDTIVVTVTF